MTAEQRAAVERLRRYHDNVFDPSAVYGASWGSNPQVQQDAARVVAMYLAEHPSDDELPLTEEWWTSVGFRLLGDDINDGPDWWQHTSGLKFWEADSECWICDALDQGGIEKEFRTRGDVRRLCSALGIELTATR